MDRAKKRKEFLKIVLCCFAKALKKDKQICTCRHHLSPSLELTGNIPFGKHYLPYNMIFIFFIIL